MLCKLRLVCIIIDVCVYSKGDLRRRKMRSKKVIIAVLVMFVLSTGVVFAAAVNGEFN